MGMTQLTQKVIESDFCPRCLHYIDKKFIFRDCESGTTITMGTVKDCKFHTDTSWICDFNEVEDGNDTNVPHYLRNRIGNVPTIMKAESEK